MGLIDEAKKAALDKKQEERQREHRRQVDEAEKRRIYLEGQFGYKTVTEPELLEVATWKTVYGERAWGGSQSVSQPVIEKMRSHLVADEVRIVRTYGPGTTGLQTYLLRNCSRCARIGIEGRSFYTIVTGDKGEQARRDAFSKSVGEHYVQAFLCSFCTSDDKALACPTCGQGFER